MNLNKLDHLIKDFEKQIKVNDEYALSAAQCQPNYNPNIPTVWQICNSHMVDLVDRLKELKLTTEKTPVENIKCERNEHSLDNLTWLSGNCVNCGALAKTKRQVGRYEYRSTTVCPQCGRELDWPALFITH